MVDIHTNTHGKLPPPKSWKVWPWSPSFIGATRNDVWKYRLRSMFWFMPRYRSWIVPCGVRQTDSGGWESSFMMLGYRLGRPYSFFVSKDKSVG
jgi:hypothetical protein